MWWLRPSWRSASRSNSATSRRVNWINCSPKGSEASRRTALSMARRHIGGGGNSVLQSESRRHELPDYPVPIGITKNPSPLERLRRKSANSLRCHPPTHPRATKSSSSSYKSTPQPVRSQGVPSTAKMVGRNFIAELGSLIKDQLFESSFHLTPSTCAAQ